ncbi:hypothetical protein [Flaviaesturariibacter amylovorans]|uniref:YtxH domain-containing protein n=1 Tax=Flaviaesturariibacter amylovorans TaxID=1084520 RepID=A0ABP8HMI3_9BACT
MKKILLGALVCAAVAGVVAYAINPEKMNETLGDLKKKAEDLLGKASETLDDLRTEAGSQMG